MNNEHSSSDDTNWLLPLLLDICEENFMFTYQEINERKLSIKKDFFHIYTKAIALRPSKWTIFNYLYDDIRKILELDQQTESDFNEFSKDAFSISLRPEIKSIISDDLIFFKNWTNDLISIPNFPKIDNNYYFTNYGENIPIILLSALFGSYKIFNYFFNKNDLIQIKSNYGDDLIKSSIIGGNHRILLILRKLNFDLGKYLDIAITYHRNDICIWLMNNYNLNANKKLAEKEKNFDLLEQLKFLSERSNKRLTRGGKRPHNS